jgi:hypothetical protein
MKPSGRNKVFRTKAGGKDIKNVRKTLEGDQKEEGEVEGRVWSINLSCGAI